MPAQKLLHQLIASRYRPHPTRQQILLQEKNRSVRQKRPRNSKFWTGVYNGHYYRIPKVALPSATSSLPRALPVLPKLYTPTSPPAQLPPIVSGSSCSKTSVVAALPNVVQTAAQTFSRGQSRKEFWERLWQWFQENYSTLILNFGSICTLFGFTRSDVLELRCLSVTGSVCAIVYHITTPPLRIPPLLWSSTFAVVNGYKIYEIVQEREGSVQLTTEQEEMYSNFFMPHGVTPKQFEMIFSKAEVLHVKKGTFLIRQNEAFQHVDLVVSGTTRASALGRFLTAASTTPTAHEERAGGASGAWIGEMCLLERVWVKEQKSSPVPVASPSSPQTRISKPTRPSLPPLSDKDDDSIKAKQAAAGFTDTGLLEGSKGPPAVSNETAEVAKQGPNGEPVPSNLLKASSENKPIRRTLPQAPPTGDQPPQPKLVACRSMHTIIAQDDCIVLRWQHADMERLMEKSTDMRAALTRAMTAAIVGKVINFTVSRSRAAQTWGTWLSDWKYNAGAEVHIGDEGKPAADEIPVGNQENLPNYPIKQFR